MANGNDESSLPPITGPGRGKVSPGVAPTIEGYQITEPLGEGGMGTVWSAVQLSTRRDVALKLLGKGAFASEKDRARFEREVELSARLQHPNIAQIYDSGLHLGVYYYAMELIEGVPLDKYVKEEHLTQRQILDLMGTVCQAVQHAHERGIIHRDLKPSNILVTPDGKPHVLDFGLAKAFLEADSDLSVSADGEAAGTPAYMSPEQAAGHRERVDTRTDVYSLGVILFRLLTGETPHDLSGTRYEVLRRIAEEEIRRPRDVTKEVDRELEALLLKALAHDPKHRYPSAGALAQDIQNYLTGEPLTARPPTPAYFLRKRIRKHRVPIAIAFVSAGVAIAATLFFASRESPTDREKMLAVLPFENLGSPDDEYFADGVTGEILTNLAKLSGLSVISRASAMQYRKTEKTLRQIGAELGVDYILRGTMRWDKSLDPPRLRISPELIRVSDNVCLWGDRYDTLPDDIFEVQSSIAEHVVKSLHVVLLERERQALEAIPTDKLEAYDYYLQGHDYYRQRDGDRVRKLALQMFQRSVELDPAFALAYTSLSGAHLAVYFFNQDPTEERLAKAKEAVDKAFQLQPDLPEAHVAMGWYYYQGHLDYDRALKHFRIAQKSIKDESGLWYGIAAVQRRQGKLEEAVVNFRKTAKLDPRNPGVVNDVGQTFCLMGDFAQAQEYYARSISMNPDHPRACGYMAELYLRWEARTEKARRFLDEAPPEVISSDDNEVVMACVLIDLFDGEYQAALDRLSSIPADAIEYRYYFVPKAQLCAQIYGLMNDPQLEESHYESAVNLLEPLIKERPEDHRLRTALGIAYAGLARKERAIQQGKTAVELMPAAKDAWSGLYPLEGLARIYVMAGEYDKAIEQLELLFSLPGGLWPPLLRLDPVWKPLHDHPRFTELLRKYDSFGSAKLRSS